MDLFVGFSALAIFALLSRNVAGSPQFGHSESFHSYRSNGNTFTQTNSNGMMQTFINGQPMGAGVGNGIHMGMGNGYMSSIPPTPYNNGFGGFGGSSFNGRYPNGMNNFNTMPSDAYGQRDFRSNGDNYSARSVNGYKEYKINGYWVSEDEFNRSMNDYHNSDDFGKNPTIADRNYPTEPPNWFTRPTPPSQPVENFHRKDEEKMVEKSNINAENSMENTASSSEVQNEEYERLVKALIQDRLNVNKMIGGQTFLHYAAYTGNEKLARMLIQNGADFTIKNEEGKTVGDIATEEGFTKFGRVLQKSAAQKACDIYSILPKILPEDRILDGEPVHSRTEFPWMAALGYLDSSNNIHYNCAATLISDKFVLTAAHCVPDNNRPVRVRLGQLQLNRTEGTITSAINQIEQIIRHPNYASRKKLNDIALIKLVAPVYFSDFIRPACIQTHLNDENTNIDLTVAGWGVVSTDYQNRSNSLLKATLNTIPWSKCNATIFNHTQSGMNGQPFQNGIDQCHYCAADPNGMSDTCQGDSGGPLQILRSDLNSSTVVGVVSTGFSCGNNLPGIYTRVAHFIDWIESHVWPNGEITTPLPNEA